MFKYTLSTLKASIKHPNSAFQISALKFVKTLNFIPQLSRTPGKVCVVFLSHPVCDSLLWHLGRYQPWKLIHSARDEWTKTTWHMHTLKFYSILKSNEGIVVSPRSQFQFLCFSYLRLTVIQKYEMIISRNKQLVHFKLCAILE